MNFDNLKDPELQEKLKACTTSEELFELAKSVGVELSEEEFDSMAGGGVWDLPDPRECEKHCPTQYHIF